MNRPATCDGRRATRAGFTLVEMMVVIVIIGILATIIIVNVAGRSDEAAATATKAIIKQVAGQAEMFKMHHNKYPDNLIDLLMMPPYVDPKKWPPGGYLTDPPVDGWGREFLYRVPGSENYPYDIVSLGADGKEGGEGVNADVWNRTRK